MTAISSRHMTTISSWHMTTISSRHMTTISSHHMTTSSRHMTTISSRHMTAISSRHVTISSRHMTISSRHMTTISSIFKFVSVSFPLFAWSALMGPCKKPGMEGLNFPATTLPVKAHVSNTLLADKLELLLKPGFPRTFQSFKLF